MSTSTPDPTVRPHPWASLRVQTVVVWLVATLGLLATEAAMRSRTADAVHFQPWDSELLMQTVSVRLLRDEPAKTLWYLHIHPPMLDGLRAALAVRHRALAGQPLVDAVDTDLYRVYAVFFGGAAALIFLWLSAITGRRLAWLGAAVFCLHPAAIYYASLVGSTFMSATFVLWTCYELWRFTGAREDGKATGSIPRLCLAFLLTFLTRSVFQLPTVLLFAVALALRRVHWTRIAVFVAITGAVAGAYTLKQWLLFDVPSTSSFMGLNLSRSIDGQTEPLTDEDLDAHRAHLVHDPGSGVARVLDEPLTLTGQNHNSLDHLAHYKAGMLRFRKRLAGLSVLEVARLYRWNLRRYMAASSRYAAASPHVILERLPWRPVGDAMFSGYALTLLMWVTLLTFAISARRDRRRLLAGIGLALPVLYIFAVSVLGERGENNRFKFLIEPVLIVLVVSQLRVAITACVDAFGRYRERTRTG